MKNILFGITIGLLLSGIMAFTVLKEGKDNRNLNQTQPEKDLSLARVQKMSGKLVFLSCEPVSSYDVAFEIRGVTLSTMKTPNEMANFVVKNALRISKRDSIEFDGVVIGSGKVDIAITFK